MTARHLVAVAIVGALVGLWVSPGRGYSLEAPAGASVPCDEAWRYPGTAGAAACASLELTADRMPRCVAEDGSGQARCVWDARHMGNGEGQSVVIRHGGTDDMTVTVVTHKRAHRLAWRVQS